MLNPMQDLTTVNQLTEIQQAALTWHEAGCQVIPAIAGKRPAFDWKTLQDQKASATWVQRVHAEADGVGIICGAISGNLEMLELEGRATSSWHIDRIIEACDERKVTWLWNMLTGLGYSEWTPSGGLHFLYRINDHEIPGNTPVARRPANAEELAENPKNKVKVLAETRGEGGFVVVAPSGGSIHPDGGTWSVASGEIGSIPHIDWKDRCLLHEAIHAALDEMPQEEPVTFPAQQLTLTSDRPGDDFNARGDWAQILEPHGWRIHHRSNTEVFWTRPGKKKLEGWSASTGYDKGADRLFVWSSSTEFEQEKPYDKFSAFTLLEFGAINPGTFKQAARKLGSMGYGTPLDTTNYAGVVLSSIPTQTAATNETQGQVALRDKEGLPVYPNELLSRMDWHQIGVARTYAAVMENTFSYIPRQNQWMYWNQEKWVEENKGRPDNAAATMAERMYNHAKATNTTDPELGKNLLSSASKLTTKSAINGILSIAKSDPRIATEETSFDKNQNLLTLANGIFNLNTMTLGAFDPKLMLTKQIQASYQPNVAKGRWAQFMEEVLPDADVRQYLQRACGYMLTGTLDERVMFLIHGESGTGKTQFLEAIGAVMGDFSGIAPASAFQPRPPGAGGPSEDLHKLMGKRFVMQSELDAGSKINESLVKSIVGGDTQTSRTLYGKNVDWRPQYTVFLATNYLPRISSSDNAIWNRVKPIKFEQVFIDASGEALDPSSRNLGRRMAEECADEILAWMLEGLIAYREMGLTEPAAVRSWLNGYREDVDTVRQFIAEGPGEDRIEIAEGKQVKVRELYKAFLAFCADNGITPLGSRSFTERMLSAGWVKEKREKGIMWQGIGLGGFIMESQTPARRYGG